MSARIGIVRAGHCLALLLGVIATAGCVDYFAELPLAPDRGSEVGLDGPTHDTSIPDSGPDATPPDMRPDASRPDTTPPDRGSEVGPDACLPATFEHGADEECNGRDDDCDGVIDEANDLPRLPPAQGLSGVCAGPGAYRTCEDGVWRDPAPGSHPRHSANELCDGLDNDCDGSIDESLDACHPCVPRLDDDAQCNGLDDDCDGRIDEDCVLTICPSLVDGRPAPPCNDCPDGTQVPDGWVCIPAGRFEMGRSREECRDTVDGVVVPAFQREGGRPECHESPPWSVALSRPFLMKATEETREEWAAFYGGMDDERIRHPAGMDPCVGEPSKCPVASVHWYMVVLYLNELSEAHGLKPCYAAVGCDEDLDWRMRACNGIPAEQAACTPEVAPDPAFIPACNGYRLPTEAEWEYAAREGGRPGQHFPAGAASLELSAWYNHTEEGAGPRVVGTLDPNKFGLHDMHGNVAEWVTDTFMSRYPPGTDGIVTGDGSPMNGTRDHFVFDPYAHLTLIRGSPARVVRGGAFNNREPEQVSASRRAAAGWCNHRRDLGFRMVRSVP